MKRSTRVMLPLSAVVLAVFLVMSGQAAPQDDRPARPKMVTLTGVLVDVYSYMTAPPPRDERAAAEQGKVIKESLKNGVPACIETEDGLYILGKGVKAPIEQVVPLANQEVEVRGKMFEKGGVHYVDIVSIKAVKHEEEGEHPAGEEGEAGEEDPGEEEEP